MKKNRSRIGIGLLLAVIALSDCAKSAPEAGPAALPPSWYDLSGSAPSDESSERASEEAVGQALDETLSSQLAALEELPADGTMRGAHLMGLSASTQQPWHVAAFITDLAVSAKGVLGSLIMKGTPAVSLIWRKKGSATPHQRLESLAAGAAAPDVTLNEDSGQEVMAEQLEAAVRTAMASGKIANEANLRSSLRSALGEFRELTRGLEVNPGKGWWVSRLRMDVSVDASGKAAFFTSLGAEVRLRFEWHRIKRSRPRQLELASSGSGDTRSEAKRSLDDLILAVAGDLDAMIASGASDQEHGLQPYGFRVGVGVTSGGNFGVAKGSTSVVGQIYFNREARKPPVLGLALREPGAIAMIAEASQGSGSGSLEQVAARVNRNQFRNGLRRALRMGRFFAARAAKVKPGHWGVHELRTAYDMSVSGNFGIATVGGTATSEINFYNEEF